MILSWHQQMVDTILEFIKDDDRFVGLTLGGSFIEKCMDEFSDLDFVVVISETYYDEIMSERLSIVENFGELLSAFTGEHVGEPRLVICLYDNPLLHVDFKFVSLNDAANRVENPVILYEKNACLTEAFAAREAIFPMPSLQWIEDRFWVWIHYATTKIGRNELFETIEFISFIRQSVIGPLILMKNNKLPRGVRKIEIDAPDDIKPLIDTVAKYDRKSCIESIRVIIRLYLELREYHASADLIKREKAQERSIMYFEEVALR